MTSSTLFWSVVFGSLGMGYCVYGRRQHALVPFLSGVALIVAPYFVRDSVLLVALCLALAAAPFVIKP